MNTDRKPLQRRTPKHAILNFLFLDQSGQTLPLIALFMTAILAMAGFVVDVGHVYVVQEQLQNSANAAALAAAGKVYTSNTATVNSTTQADLYGGTGTENPNSYETTAPVIQQVCLNLLMPSGTTCTSASVANAVRVTENASVNTYFMKLFGVKTVATSATAMASMIGGEAQPWNVAIILDATGSMNSADPNCGSGVTQFQCATTAIKGMLAAASPCDPGAPTCVASNANMHVALFSFPGISTNTVSNDTTSCNTPNFMQYTLPLPGLTSYTPISYTQGGTTWTGTYEIVPFSSNYYSPSSPNNLNAASTLVNAVNGCMSPIVYGNSGTGGLLGAPSNGGVTYYAATIYAAQSALLAEQTANPGSKNAIVLLSDGQANIPPPQPSLGFPGDFPGELGAKLASGSTGYTTPGVNGPGLYPDIKDECQQAIQAAQDVTTAGTRVYAVSYGSEVDGCSSTFGSSGTTGSYGTDSTTVAIGLNAPFTATTITPCITMENIASSLDYFYSDYNQYDVGSGVNKNCVDNAHAVSNLNDILLSVVSDFLRPRLLPNNAPYTVVKPS
jgi:Flp pilus assembly protein TadG